MKITRLQGLGLYHEVVICGERIYLAGLTSEAEGIAEQTGDVLRQIDELLALAGSDKDHILRVTVYLKNIADFSAMNTVWAAWINKEHAPTRATVEAQLAEEEILVEMVVDAVKKD